MIFFFGPYVLLSDLCLDHRTMFERTLRVQGYADRSQLDQFSMEFRNSPSMFVRALLKKGYDIKSCSRSNWLISAPQGLTQKNSWICGFLFSNLRRLVIAKHVLSGAWSWGILQAKKIRSAFFASPILCRLLFHRPYPCCRPCLTPMFILWLFLPRHSSRKHHNRFPSGKGRNGQISPTRFVHRYPCC